MIDSVFPFKRYGYFPQFAKETSMKKEVVVIFLVVAMLLVSSCASIQIGPATRVHLGEEHVFQKNYEINRRLIAYVGQPVIKVRDYWINRYGADKSMRTSDDFVIKGGTITITGQANTDYIIEGETNFDGKSYTVLKIPGGSRNRNFGLLINEDGSVHDKVINMVLNFEGIMAYSFISDPANLKFIRLEEQEISTGKGKLNYELLYGGTDGKMITITYREFTPENLARSSFYQNLVFDSKQKTIRFRDTLIEVHSADNEKIDFTVISDNLDK